MKKIFIALAAMAVLFSGGCARAPKQVPPPVVITPTTMPSAGLYHTVQKGQTLYSIAKLYNVNVNELMRANRIANPSKIELGRQLFVPTGLRPTGAQATGYAADVQRLVGPRRTNSVWKTITVHHSGTKNGSAELFDRDHRRRRMGGLFYHFVIGNGTNSGDGLVEVGWRWKAQVKANRPYDIQICLVGNFDFQQVSDAQLASLVELINTLRQQYNVPITNIRQHCDIRGKHTDCPGKLFPFRRLLSMVASHSRV